MGFVSGNLHYDADTGIFTRNGKCAGNPHGRGYRQIYFEGKRYPEHHVAWFMVNGVWPLELGFVIDHIDGNRSNNAISNLRLATNQENNRNQKTRSDNTSGHKGVYWRAERQSWRVVLNVSKGKVKQFGCYKDFELACLVADAAREKYHGEFASFR